MSVKFHHFLITVILVAALISKVRTNKCGVRNQTLPFNYYIMGGRPALIGEFPWMVTLQYYILADQIAIHACGGALIKSNWVLTAAHCLAGFPLENLFVVAGEHDLTAPSEYEQRVAAAKVYLYGSLHHDIALVRLKKHVRIDGVTTNTLCLPEDNFIPRGVCSVSGWGITTPSNKEPAEILQTVDLPILDLKYCAYLFNAAEHLNLRTDIICAGDLQGRIDTCQYDSGSALVCEYNSTFYATGIVSRGKPKCEDPSPGIYTRVSSYRKWIDAKINGYDE